MEHVLNSSFALPTGQSLAQFLTPTFYNGNSASFPLSLPNDVLFWHGGLIVDDNVPNAGNLSSYCRFLSDAPATGSALLLSVSPGVGGVVVQTFASYADHGGRAVEGPCTIAARVMLLSGALRVRLANVNGHTQHSIATDASTPKGVWTVLQLACPSPAPGQDHSMIVLGSSGPRGVVALIDKVSVLDA